MEKVDLIVGQRYSYNFPASPSGIGTFRGWTAFGWIVWENRDGQIHYTNPSLLCTIKPSAA